MFNFCFNPFDLICSVFLIQSFFNDDAQKQLFEQVLTNLGISAEEKTYVRELVNTDGGLEKLLSSKYCIYILFIERKIFTII